MGNGRGRSQALELWWVPTYLTVTWLIQHQGLVFGGSVEPPFLEMPAWDSSMGCCLTRQCLGTWGVVISGTRLFGPDLLLPTGRYLSCTQWLWTCASSPTV